MNTLKIFSILIFGIIGFAIAILISYKTLVKRKPNSIFISGFMLQIASIFISTSILLNLVFGKISKLYDVIDQSYTDFITIFHLSKTNYGISPEMFKIIFIYIGITIGFIFFFSIISKILSKTLIADNSISTEIISGIILLCLSVAFYPIIDQILNSIY
jgi:hypothetical protein